MVTFWCPRYPSYSLWDRNTSYHFERGVLETDELGAAFIRKHPLFGRVFLEQEPPPPRPDRHPELKGALADGFGVCDECDAEFETPQALKMHKIRVHHNHRDKEE